MRFLSIYYFLIFMLWQMIFVACTEYPELDIPEYTLKIAVDGFIEAGEPPVMYLTYSSAFINEYDSMDFVDMVKFNVSAYVITEEGDTIGFTRKTRTENFPPYKYTMAYSDLVGEPGKTYRLLIRKTGEEDITAETTIPLSSPIIYSVDSIFHSAVDTMLRYQINMPNTSNLQYFFIQNKKSGEKDMYPVQLPAKSSRFAKGDTLTFEMVNRKNTNLWMSEDSLEQQVGDKSEYDFTGYYHVDDKMYFKVSRLEEQGFDVLSSIFIDTRFPDNPFKPISQLPISNVSNGIGHWTGINSVTFTADFRP